MGRATIPLTLRVPNPPHPFVGRDAELAALDRALDGGRAALVVGLPGIGKSALARAWVARRESAQDAVLISIEPSPRPGDARTIAAQALAQVLRVSATGGTDPAGDLALALDMADEAELLVVIDDATNASAGSVMALLAGADAYARRARWLVLSREAPEGAAVSLNVSAMSKAEMTKLADAVAADLDAHARERSVKEAHGSPGRLRAALLGSREPDGVGDWEGTESIAELAGGVPVSVAEALAREGARSIARLIRRGVLELGGLGVRVVDAARTGTRASDEEARALMARLEADGEAGAVAAVRLATLRGDVASAVAILARRRAAIAEAGLDAELWRALGTSPEPALELERLRCAASTADPAMLREVTEPVGGTPADRFIYTRVLWARGELAAAEASARELADEADDPKLAAEARLLEALCLSQQGAMRRALAVLEGMFEGTDPPTDEHACRRDALVVLTGNASGALDRDAARSRIEELLTRATELAPKGRDLVLRLSLQTAYRVGDLRLAGRAIDALPEGPAVPASGDQRRLRLVRGSACTQSGDLSRARRDFTAVLRVESRHTFLGASAVGYLLELRLVSGEVEDAAAELRELEAVATRMNAGGLLVNTAYYRCMAAWASADRSLLPESVESRDPVARSILEPAIARAHARFGAPIELPDPEDGAHPRALILTLLARAEAAIVRDPTDGRVMAERARDEASRWRYRVLEAEAELAIADAALRLGDRASARDAAERCAALAETIGATRLREDARFARWAASDRPTARGLVSELDVPHARSMGARRAKGFLGESAPLDAIDRAVLEALSARGVSGARRLSRHGDGDRDGARWGIALEEKRAWLATDGGEKDVELGHTPSLWALLASLARRGGRASKEELVLDVWAPSEYHPLRHDGRLRAAARNLRAALGDEPPYALLTTTEDGYALGGRVLVE
ncbi:MAG: AAA family ATPase [Sandaracinaceae bacterium]